MNMLTAIIFIIIFSYYSILIYKYYYEWELVTVAIELPGIRRNGLCIRASPSKTRVFYRILFIRTDYASRVLFPAVFIDRFVF